MLGCIQMAFYKDGDRCRACKKKFRVNKKLNAVLGLSYIAYYEGRYANFLYHWKCFDDLVGKDYRDALNKKTVSCLVRIPQSNDGPNDQECDYCNDLFKIYDKHVMMGNNMLNFRKFSLFFHPQCFNIIAGTEFIKELCK